MPSPGLIFFAVIIGVAAGCLLGTQPSINGNLAQNVAHPLQASFISFATGTAIIFVLSTCLGAFPPKFTTPPSTFPWWYWCGGAIGVVMVTSSLVLVPRIGSLIWFAAVISGQVGISIILDHFGLLGNPKTPASSMRLFGALLLIAGVLVIVQAKRAELNAEVPPTENVLQSDEFAEP